MIQCLSSSSAFEIYKDVNDGVPSHHQPTGPSKGHVTGYQPIRDQFYLIRSVPASHHSQDDFCLVVSVSVRGPKSLDTDYTWTRHSDYRLVKASCVMITYFGYFVGFSISATLGKCFLWCYLWQGCSWRRFLWVEVGWWGSGTDRISMRKFWSLIGR